MARPSAAENAANRATTAVARSAASRRARSPLAPSDGNIIRSRSSRPELGLQPRCSPSETDRHDLLSPVWYNAATVVPSKRQRRVLKPFPLLRMVLTRPQQEELSLLRLAKAFAVGDESLTLDQLLKAAGAPSYEEVAPTPAPTPPQSRSRRTVSGDRARLCFERSRAASCSADGGSGGSDGFSEPAGSRGAAAEASPV